MAQLQGLANIGLMAQLQNFSQQQQSMQQQAESMQLLQTMLTQKPIPNVASSNASSSRSNNQLSNGHKLPETEYPEAVSSPPQNSGTSHFDSFGISIAKNEPVLENEVRKEGYVRELALNSMLFLSVFNIIISC